MRSRDGATVWTDAELREGARLCDEWDRYARNHPGIVRRAERAALELWRTGRFRLDTLGRELHTRGCAIPRRLQPVFVEWLAARHGIHPGRPATVLRWMVAR